MSTPVPLTRTPRQIGQDKHRAGETAYCSICRLDRARRSRAARIHKQVRDRRVLHQLIEALR